jgi:ribonuclease VapC
MIFVDASALVSLAAQEADALDLAGVLESDSARLTSPIALWETVAGLCRTHIFSVESARNRVKRLCDLFGLQIVGIGQREYDLAQQAYAEFGKGRHPAALNMGDCFAYACAKAHGAALLFKGEEFSRTDVLMAKAGDL